MGLQKMKKNLQTSDPDRIRVAELMAKECFIEGRLALEKDEIYYGIRRPNYKSPEERK